MRERQVVIKTDLDSKTPSDSKLKELFNNYYEDVESIEISREEANNMKVINVYIRQHNVSKNIEEEYYKEHNLISKNTDIGRPFAVVGWENNI